MTRKCSVSAFILCLIAQGCAVQAGGEDEAGGVEGEAQALEKPKLLALGDSVAFGYDPFAPGYDKDKDFAGYPEAVGEFFSVKNAACTGESSGSFIDPAQPDNGCDGYRAAYPLHVNYHEDETQLDFALRRLADEDGMPDVITLNIGGNDIFLTQQACNYDPDCFLYEATRPGGMLETLAGNVATILGSLRGSGFQGQLVFVNLYSTDASTDAFVEYLNYIIRTQVLPYFGALEADAYGAFKAAAGGMTPCQAGLLIPNPDVPGICDVHPTQAGDDAFAGAVLDALQL